MKISLLCADLKAAVSSKQINNIITGYLFEKYGIDTFAMTCYHKYGTAGQSIVKYSYTSDRYRIWHEHYYTQKFYEVDTTSEYSKKCGMPIFWDIATQIEMAKNSREKEMRLDSDRFGLVRGLSIPVNSHDGEQSILMLSEMKGQNWLDKRDAVEHDLLCVAHYYDGFLRKALLKEIGAAVGEVVLSTRQMQCLKLIARNYSVAEMASTMSITERTVNFHIQNMNKSLGVHSKYAAVAKAQELGFAF